jgi:predicted nuclease of predicted toxin-antitoxin system
MKGLLLDQGLPRSTATLLVQSGLTALHAADVGLAKAAGSDILEFARARGLIVVTLDADFHTLLAASGAVSPSVIRLRRQRLNGQQAAATITATLERTYDALKAGAVASVTSTLIRVKLLPLPQPRQRPAHR